MTEEEKEQRRVEKEARRAELDAEKAAREAANTNPHPGMDASSPTGTTNVPTPGGLSFSVRAPAPKEEEMISVKRSVLDGILAGMEDLKKTNEMLVAVADKSRLAKYNDSLGSNITRIARVRTYKGQLVIGWGRLIEDTMQKDGNGIWHEKQIIPVFTEDGNTYPMLYPDFARMVKVSAEIVEKSQRALTDKEKEDLGDETPEKNFYVLKVVTKGPFFGKEIKLAENFVNS